MKASKLLNKEIIEKINSEASKVDDLVFSIKPKGKYKGDNNISLVFPKEIKKK